MSVETIGHWPRKATMFALGVSRYRDVLGETWGPYVVAAYIGKDATSAGVVLRCPYADCGCELKRERGQMSQIKLIKRCKKCKRGPVGSKTEAL